MTLLRRMQQRRLRSTEWLFVLDVIHLFSFGVHIFIYIFLSPPSISNLFIFSVAICDFLYDASPFISKESSSLCSFEVLYVISLFFVIILYTFLILRLFHHCPCLAF